MLKNIFNLIILIFIIICCGQDVLAQIKPSVIQKANYDQIINYQTHSEIILPDFTLRFIKVGSVVDPMSQKPVAYPVFEIKSPNGSKETLNVLPILTDYVPQLGGGIEFILNNKQYQIEIIHSAKFNKLIPKDSLIIYEKANDNDDIAELSFDQFNNEFLPENQRLTAGSLITVEELKTVNFYLNKAVAEYNSKASLSWEKSLNKNPNSKIGDFTIDFKNYRSQYVVGYNSNGEKIVQLNCFIYRDFNGQEAFPSWKTELVSVFDGGNGYFKMEINLSKLSYSGIRTNGVA